MALIECLVIFFLSCILVLALYSHKKQQTSVIPINWPILGMIPGVIVNAHRLHDYATEVLIQAHGTFVFKGSGVKILLTTDPLDINHILSKNFSNYPKGDRFAKIFDVLGDGILCADGKIWEISHKVIFFVLKLEGFQSMMETSIWNKVENGLLPVLESVTAYGMEIDLQDIFQRFAFDTVCKLLFNDDPESLSIEFPSSPLSKAITDAEEALLPRHVTPPWFWKLQQILRVAKEKMLSDACKTIDQFVYKYLAQKEKEYSNMKHEEEKFVFCEAVMRELNDQSGISIDPTKFLRDTIVNLMAAGKDTVSSALSWFFYLLARNPTVEEKILEEILTQLEVKGPKRWSSEELDKMVYLHGALCESLRLYPPVNFNPKCSLQPEILPSGQKVDQNTTVILSFYAMGRMKSIWGEDCMEFKPERWISSTGGIKHEPSYKFVTFNAGPRACIGKSMALSQLKIVSTSIISRYKIQMVEGQSVLPADSVRK